MPPIRSSPIPRRRREKYKAVARSSPLPLSKAPLLDALGKDNETAATAFLDAFFKDLLETQGQFVFGSSHSSLKDAFDDEVTLAEIDDSNVPCSDSESPTRCSRESDDCTDVNVDYFAGEPMEIDTEVDTYVASYDKVDDHSFAVDIPIDHSFDLGLDATLIQQEECDPDIIFLCMEFECLSFKDRTLGFLYPDPYGYDDNESTSEDEDGDEDEAPAFSAAEPLVAGAISSSRTLVDLYLGAYDSDDDEFSNGNEDGAPPVSAMDPLIAGPISIQTLSELNALLQSRRQAQVGDYYDFDYGSDDGLDMDYSEEAMDVDPPSFTQEVQVASAGTMYSTGLSFCLSNSATRGLKRPLEAVTDNYDNIYDSRAFFRLDPCFRPLKRLRADSDKSSKDADHVNKIKYYGYNYDSNHDYGYEPSNGNENNGEDKDGSDNDKDYDSVYFTSASSQALQHPRSPRTPCRHRQPNSDSPSRQPISQNLLFSHITDSPHTPPRRPSPQTIPYQSFTPSVSLVPESHATNDIYDTLHNPFIDLSHYPRDNRPLPPSFSLSYFDSSLVFFT